MFGTPRINALSGIPIHSGYRYTTIKLGSCPNSTVLWFEPCYQSTGFYHLAYLLSPGRDGNPIPGAGS
uniref:Uncharacterized protein n=1 Tax=Romanomermis culicivorax TaxID=13658 RepID=A0A915K6N4_ROMCU